MPSSLLRPRAAAAFGLTTLAGLLTLAGCHPNAPAASSAAAPSAASPSTLVAGQNVYQANGCARCHSLNGQGGRRGPDLSHVGKDARHTAEWLASYVKNPKQVDPGSRMPPFDGKIQDADLQTLAAYLVSQK